jgi:dipeptidyl aminopeptidase/acylaminoacyl peptidase
MKIPIVALLMLGLLGASPAPGRHPFGTADWQAISNAGVHAVAPDGRTVLYEVTHGRATGTDVHEWHTISVDGTGNTTIKLPKSFTPYGFTTNAHQLYGSFEVHDADQLAIWTIGDKRAHAITSIPGGITGAVISPDATRFALVADPRPPDPLDKTRTVIANDPASLYVVDANGAHGAWWCNGLTQVGGFAWSPDGTQIATLSQTPKIGYHAVRSRIDICTATSSRRVASIANATINEIPYPGAGIAWTSGGKELAFLSTVTDVITPDHLFTVAAAGGTPQDRTSNIVGSVEALRGDAHGNVWVTVAHGVQTEVHRYRDNVLAPAYVMPDAVVGMPATTELRAALPSVAVALNDPTHATNIAVPHGATLIRITHVGDDVLSHVALGRVIRHHWTSADGVALEAIVTFPANYDGKAGKFLVLPHGGPEANDTLRLDAFARLIAGRGYVVMQPEYRGSTGYGSAHLQAIYQHFGDTAYRDVDAATSEAIAQGWADSKRLAIFGWSAGGFMTSWTVTQTNRYRAAIEGAGITEWLSFIMSSDVQQTDYDARMLEKDPAPFLQYSAVMYADKVTTPLLILHGAADERVPTYQGREYFVLLKELGKTTRMVTYPGSPHFPRLWQQRRNVFDEIGAWLDKYNP